MESRVQSADKSKPRVAVVIHRFADDSGGGAEEYCRTLVRALRETWELDVLTTCSKDHHRWTNDLAPGVEERDGFRTIRFAVAHRKRRALSALLGRVLPRIPHPRSLENIWLDALGPVSPGLLDHLRRSSGIYRAVIFLPYLYPTTVYGLPLAGPRTLLIPAAHDEPAIRSAAHRDALTRAGALAFLTPEEADLVEGVIGRPARAKLLLGAELEPQAWTPGDAESFRRKHGINGRFLLYLGRIERSKGLPALFAMYESAPERLPPLVLAGRLGPLRIPRWARHVGFLSDEEKRGALAACEALVQPSALESLSLVLLEAWAQRRPAIVNGRCGPMAGQCSRSGGGLVFRSRDEFIAAVRALGDQARRAALGECGHRYTRANHQPGCLRARLVPFLEGLGWTESVRNAEVQIA